MHLARRTASLSCPTQLLCRRICRARHTSKAEQQTITSLLRIRLVYRITPLVDCEVGGVVLRCVNVHLQRPLQSCLQSSQRTEMYPTSALAGLKKKRGALAEEGLQDHLDKQVSMTLGSRLDIFNHIGTKQYLRGLAGQARQTVEYEVRCIACRGVSKLKRERLASWPVSRG